MPGRRSPRARPGTSRFQGTANSGSCSSPTARTRRCASSCARPWRRFRISATEGASQASSTAYTASPPIPRGTSTRPRRTRASACRNSSIKALARSRRAARACCGRAPGEIRDPRENASPRRRGLAFSRGSRISPGARPQHALAALRDRANAFIDEFLHALALVRLGRVEVPLGIGGDAVYAVELAWLAPSVAEIRNLLQGLAQDDAHLLVLAVGEEHEPLFAVL